MVDHVSGGSVGGNAGTGGSPAGGQANTSSTQSDNHNGGDQTGGIGQEQLYAIQEQLQAHQGENAQLKATMDAMRAALNPQAAGNEADAEPDMSWYDDILRIGFEAEKAGKGIPVTVDLATRVKSQIAENAQLRREMAQMKAQMQRVANPETLHNQRVYENIDNHIVNSIESLYGEVDPQFAEYVSAKMASQIKQLQKDNPDAWQKVRSSDKAQRALVQQALNSAMPSQVREKLRQDYLANSPMSDEEFAAAYAQAEQIQDPRLREKVKTEARQRYWEAKFTKNKGNSFRGMVARNQR